MSSSDRPEGASADMRERLAALSADKRVALEALLRRRGVTMEAREPAPPIMPRPRGGAVPLSFDQQRMWFLHQLDPQGSHLHLQLRAIFDAPVEILERALDRLIERHEVLRTTYALVLAAGGAREPAQHIHAHVPRPLPVVDLSQVPDDGLTAAALPRINDERVRPFDLAQGPVWRAVAFRLSRERSAVCLTVHHIATDGWSIDRLIAELRECCGALREARAPRLAPLPIQYADFAAWQRECLQGEVLEAQLGWWRQRLAGMPQVLDLRTDLPRPPVASGRGAAFVLPLPDGLVDQLRAVGARCQATPFMTLLAVYKCLLARNTGQFDVVVGTPVAGRTRPELESVQGLFLNNLVLRTDLSGDLAFDEVLARVRDTVSTAFAHQEVPFDKVVGAVQPQRDLSRNPLFQALFTQPILDQYTAGLSREDPGDEAQTLPQGQGEFDLGLWFEDYGGQATLSWHYATDLFLQSTIERLARQFVVLARALAEDPSTRFEHVDLLGDAERKALEREAEAARADLSEEPVTRLIERQARSAPQAVALLFEGHVISRGELDARANRLARHLRAQGATRGSRVAVHLERGIDMVVAVLAVMKAAAAYVPMDPAYPVGRLTQMLEDSGAVLRLSSEALRAALPSAAVRVVSLDGDAAAIAAQPTDPLPDAAAPDDLAYLIYTSGSMGRPKGVMVEHGALSNFLQSMARSPGCGETDVLVAVTTLSFDIAGLELYLPLMVGARLVLAPSATAADGAALCRLLEASGATLMQATPATWRLLLAAGWRGHPGLKMLCGGEALPRDLAERLLPCGGELWNLYGPTETTIWSAAGRVQHGRGPVALGAPIANTTLHVLDRHGRRVPAGVVGELAIGGAGVARGYWQRDELTSQRFVPDPFDRRPGARMYLTGDAVRRLGDGTLEFIGRNDGQVKLRGFRIELGEIESVLARVEGVAQAAVLLREDRPGDARLVGYVVPAAGAALGANALREAAARSLPAHMLPSAWVPLDAMPLTPNGKLDRKALPPPSLPAGVEHAAPTGGLELRLAAIWQQVLGIDRVDRYANFFDLGGDSLGFVQVQAAIQDALGLVVPVVALFEHPTIESLARHLSPSVGAALDVQGLERGRRIGDEQRRFQRQGSAPDDASIAVVGLHGRFPGAPDIDAFWSLLREGREGVQFFDAETLIAQGHDPALVRHPDYVPAKAVAPEVDRFDAAFFGYAPADAAAMDPQQRIFLEHAWAALDDAGIDPQQAPGPIGVYAATSINSYALRAAMLTGEAGHAFLNDKDYLATRTAYKLDLQGPAVTVQTACSSSLVAIVEACESLRAHRCRVALAGGVSVGVPLASGHLWQQGGVGSRDGHCRAFDAEASGCVQGDGAAVVVLMRLADAMAGGHVVHAVVRGSAVNNDGALKAGFTAPSVRGQAECIGMALATAGVEADTVDYVETHGTGTALGDPIEIAALSQAFGPAGRARRCNIGSVKTNIGHLDAAAGVAGFVKAVLCLRERTLVPSLHFRTPNPKLGLEQGPFEVQTRTVDWPAAPDHPRRCGVSSFGIGGTNAHVVLEEAPPQPVWATDPGPQLIVVSARRPEALQAAQTRLAARLRDRPELPLAAVAWTLQSGRRAFEHRRALVAGSVADAVHALDPPRRGGALRAGQADAGTVFMFSGQGAQHAGMARGLWLQGAAFRADVDTCAEALRESLGLDLRGLLFPADDAAALEAAQAQLTQTRFAQPALFVVEWALARMWQRLGVTPAAMIGHSLGEWVAATIAGVFSLGDALQLVALRGRLMQAQAPGVMLGLPFGAAQAMEWLAPGLELAADNAPSSCVVSGSLQAVEALEHRLAEAGLAGQRLRTSHAFHSSTMDPAVDPLVEAVARVPRRPPARPFVSNLTGTWITDAEATDPAYWGRQMRGTVRFREGLATVLEQPRRLLEVGPGRALATLAAAHERREAATVVVASLGRAQDRLPDEQAVLAAVGRLWEAGQSIDWAALRPAQPAPGAAWRVPLPGYPFEGQRYWYADDAARLEAPRAARVLHKHSDPARWCWLPVWQGEPARIESVEATGDWLLFAGREAVGDALAGELASRGARVLRVDAGDRLRQTDATRYTIDPTDPGAYLKVLDSLGASGISPTRVVHAFALDVFRSRSEDAALDLGFYSVLYLVQALAARRAAAMPRLDVIGAGLFAVSGSEALSPGAAAVVGITRVVPQELPDLCCRLIDVALDGADAPPMARALCDELLAESEEPVIALRGRRRWLQRFEPLRPPPARQSGPRLRRGGTVLLTGGLGAVGLTLAERLSAETGSSLVLVGRSAFPPREAWNDWLGEHGDEDPTSQRIRRLLAIEGNGSAVMTASVDVADEAALRALAGTVKGRFEPLTAIVHAAGIVGGESFAPLTRLSRAECELQFRAKFRGLQGVQRVFDHPGLDAFVVVSSISTVLGGLGLAAYAAANQAADAWVHARHAEGQNHWMSIDWDAWQFDPAAAASARPGSLAALAMTPEEGARVFDRLMRQPRTPQIVVSTADLPQRIERGRTAQPEAADEATPQPAPSHARPALPSNFVAPRSDVERAIAEVWQELLGIDQVGVYDNFFDLGGHSLLALRAAARLREKLGLNVSLDRFLELGTIDQLAWQSLGQVAASLQPTDARPAPSPQRSADAAASAAAEGPAPAAATMPPTRVAASDSGPEPAAGDSPPVPELEPFYFDAGGRRLFGLLRRAPAPREAGIVLCPPHAHEYVRCHRALRELAQQLAWLGFDVLNFDYFGCGDSAGEYEQARLETWCDDTRAAIDELKRRAGLRRVQLAGLRLGGTLAFLGAQGRDDVDALALWDPVVNGEDLREQVAAIATLQASSETEQRDAEQSDVLAWPAAGALADDIAALNLCTWPLGEVPRLLVLETGLDGSGRRLVDLARAQGASAEHRRVDEARVWTREPYEAVAPRTSLGLLAAWFGGAAQ